MNWLFQPTSFKHVNNFRILVCAISAIILLSYFTIAELVFSNIGLTTSAEIFYKSNTFSFFRYNDSPAFVYLLMFLCVSSLVLQALRIYPLVTSVCSFLLFISFFNRYPNLDYGGSMMMSVVLFLLIFQEYFDKFYPLEEGYSHGWILKIVQIQLALIYFFAGFSKLNSDVWVSGEAFARIFNSEQAVFSMPYLANLPLVSTFFSYITILAEMSFIFLVWNNKTRWYAIWAMILMHLGIFLFLHVTVFFTESFFVLLYAFYTPKADVSRTV